MDSVNKTLYIPLYGKSFVSKKGLFIQDKTAEEIWDKAEFELKGRSKSKWLAYYMGVRAAVFDNWTKQQMVVMPDAVVIHIGCGLDARVVRVGTNGHIWYDVDFEDVIQERQNFFTQSEGYKMIAGDARDCSWLDNVSGKNASVVMEGVAMYLSTEQMQQLTKSLSARFEKVALLVDTYTTFGAKMSKYKNPVKDVGVTQVYGVDDPTLYNGGQVAFVCEHTMIPQQYINQLKGVEKFIFAKLYAGGISKKLYRLFEFLQ